METTMLIQVGKDELTKIIHAAIQSALSQGCKQSEPKPFIKGIHELAAFLKVSPARAQKLKNDGVFPYWQDGRTLLFDPDKVRASMENVKTRR